MSFKGRHSGTTSLHASPLTTHGLAQLLGHSLEVPEGDLAGLVIVEQVEHLLDVLPCVLVALGRVE